ncbi:putative oxidoreductase YvaA [Pseudovibrio axinellae]|uniref:Putative oxidoreductase YvaA n=1 Tax=Pseudovibrio axinellae TaxID=989403 RepID=A0A165VZU2_9HYPH|nr:oxidoreductase [Pseudovibrio axinellae]KZL15729.1 putative oxidoreductase YvaA [Pseudovibrio axinellae]SER80906.1 scyllo-inositol 2-dehydrogenase (NADP+) [Pseudovibrio axinellae]
MSPIKTAIVGFGISGQSFQAPILESVEGLSLTSVVSSKPDTVKAQLPQATVFNSLDDLLNTGEADLIIIATPNKFHAPYAEQALRAGKHVVIEKPFCIGADEGEPLLALAEKKQKKLSVYQSRRFDGDFLTIKQLIEDGKLGQVHSFFSSYNRYRPAVKDRWRENDQPGAGILYDLGSHLIDQAVALFGAPRSVTANLRNQRPGAQAVDHFHLLLSYAETDVILHGNNLSTAEGPRFQVFGNEGAFIKFGMDTQEEMLRELKGPTSPGWGADPEALYGTFTDCEGKQHTIPTKLGGYECFYQQMVRAIREGAPVPVAPDEALTTIRVIEAAYRSNTDKKTVFFTGAS